MVPFCTQEQGKVAEVKYLSPPHQAIPGAGEDDGKNWD